VGGEHDVDRGYAIDDPRQDVLERMGALQIVRQQDAEHPEQDDPMGRAKVAP
jgi:hypothetical protein